MPPPLTAATGAALLGADARLISQEYRRVLSAPGSTASAAPLRLGFRELLYFQVVNSLTAEGLQLSPGQKREMFRVLTEHNEWRLVGFDDKHFPDKRWVLDVIATFAPDAPIFANDYMPPVKASKLSEIKSLEVPTDLIRSLPMSQRKNRR